MVKASILNPDGNTYVLGLSEGNIVRLKQGKPIAVDLADLGGRGRVLIMYGQTEQHIEAGLRAATQGTS
jgi:hypothetical protein